MRLNVYTRNVFFVTKLRLILTDNASVCIHPVIDAKSADGIEPRQRIVIPQGFMGNLGARRRALCGTKDERRAKLKMSIKSIKSEAQGRLPWNILRQRGNSFSYAISISCFASSPRPSPRSSRRCARPYALAATNLRSIRVSSLKTVNSARHQGECELAPVVLSTPIKMAVKKTNLDRTVVCFLSLLLPSPVLPSIASYLTGSYALIDALRLKVSRPKYCARGIYARRA